MIIIHAVNNYQRRCEDLALRRYDSPVSRLRRTTICLEPGLHRALRVRAAETDQSISDLVNEAVRLTLGQDAEDLAAYRGRAKEPNLDFESALKDLRHRGKL